MTFNIGSQSGGVVNNVAGNQRVEGGQHGIQISREDARSAAAALSEILLAADLSALGHDERATVLEDAAVIDAEMAAPEPSRESVGVRLERVTSLLSSAGAFVGAGAALLGPLTTLAQWLGPVGASVLRMLPVG